MNYSKNIWNTLVGTILLLTTSHYAGGAEGDTEDLKSRLSRFVDMAHGVERHYEFEMLMQIEYQKADKDVPIFADIVGAVRCARGGELLRFDIERLQEGIGSLATYEAGLRTSKSAYQTFGLQPQTPIRELAEDIPRGRQFDEKFYDLNPCFHVFRGGMALRLGTRFTTDDLVPDRVLSYQRMRTGQEKFTVASARWGGAAVYTLVFAKEPNWLPVEYQFYIPPIVKELGLKDAASHFSEIDPSKYTEWEPTVESSTVWLKLKDEVFVPDKCRLRSILPQTETIFSITYMNWRVDAEFTEERFASSTSRSLS